MPDVVQEFILNVDDDEASRYARTRTLQQAGFTCIEAATGAEVLRLLPAKRPVLVLLDVRLPDIDGFALCRKIKTYFPETLVVQISASFTSDEDRERGLSGGADGFLIAPVDEGILVATLRSLLRMRDTAAELAAEKASMEALRRLDTLAAEVLRLRDRALGAIGQGVIITDANLPENRIIYANPAFERLTGYPIAEVLGRNCRFLQGPETDPQTIARIRQALSEGAEFRGTILNYRKDGTTFVNELTISPVRDASEVLTHFVGVQTDVTKRIQVEAQLYQSQKMEALGQLTGGIAHDFNNLLTVILGNAELLIEGPTDAAHAHVLARQIAETAERGADLNQKLLAFGRRQSLKPEPLDIDQIVAAMGPLIYRTIGEHIEFKTELHADTRAALTDRTLLESAILNLAVNARDAMPKGGTLTISSGCRAAGLGEDPLPIGQDVVFVTVSDTGCGMSPEIVAHAFEPFFTTKDVGKGSGLGLSMVFGFAQQSGGHVSIESEPGRGTAITILLPSTAATALAAPHEKRRSKTQGRERVLVVEDEHAVLQFVTTQLSGLGYDVTTAQAARDALDYLEEGTPFDVLITDVVLPHGMSGVELAKKARELRPKLKIMLTSGYPEEAFEHHGRPDPDMLLLKKPYRRAQLEDALRAVIGSSCEG